MNIFQRLRRFFFGTEYVLLITHERHMLTRPVEWLGGHPYAAPYLSETRCRLLRGGGIFGQIYVIGWRPITIRMFDWFDKGRAEVVPLRALR